jgi:hypothetical protein
MNIVILNWQRILWERDQEVVKGSCRDEPKWLSMHKESLYSYLYLKLTKTQCLSYYLLCFFFNKIRKKEGGTGSAWKCGRGREKWPKQCIYI